MNLLESHKAISKGASPLQMWKTGRDELAAKTVANNLNRGSDRDADFASNYFDMVRRRQKREGSFDGDIAG